MKGAIDRLTKASHKLAEIMYQQAAQQQAAGTDGGAKTGKAGGTKQEGDVIDAEYEDAK
jgi:molecular chaperone DnaK